IENAPSLQHSGGLPEHIHSCCPRVLSKAGGGVGLHQPVPGVVLVEVLAVERQVPRRVVEEASLGSKREGVTQRPIASTIVLATNLCWDGFVGQEMPADHEQMLLRWI